MASSGVVTTSDSLRYEDTPEYNISVVVTDGKYVSTHCNIQLQYILWYFVI